MKLFKLFTTSLVLAVIGLFIYQNLAVFKTTLPFSFNLYLRETMTWSHQLYTLLLGAAGLGFLAGIMLMLKPYTRLRRLLAQERLDRQAEKTATPPPVAPPEKEPPPAP